MIDPKSPEAQSYINSMETREYKDVLLYEAEKKLKNVKVWLYIIGGIQIAIGVFFWYRFRDGGLLPLIIQVIVGLLFFMIAILVNKKPKLGVILAIIFYVGLIVVNAIADSSTLVSGIILKAIIIFGFIKGLKAATEVEELREKVVNIKEDTPLDMIN